MGNARRLVAHNLDRLRYVADLGQWHSWTGTRWEADPDQAAVIGRAIDTVASMYVSAGSGEDSDARKALAGWAMQSESLPRLRAAVRLAEAQDQVRCKVAELDTDPMLLGVANGTLELRTAKLREADPADLITHQTTVDYDPNAKCPLWLKTLERLQPDPEVRAFIQRCIGYSLTGSTGQQVMFCCYGLGSNGKSVLAETMRDLLGGYAQKAPSDLLMARAVASDLSNDVARLRGARFVAVVETEEGRRLAESRVKELTGGDTVAARFLHREFFEFRPVCKLWLMTNHRPRIVGTDDGIWRRLITIPFSQKIKDDEVDRELPDKLRAELPGILAWAVRGCLEWQRQGLNPPDVIRRTAADYRAEQDLLGGFLADCCVITERGKTTAAALYRAYQDWCSTNGHEPASQTKLGIKLTERGYTRIKSGTISWSGIALRSDRPDLGDPPAEGPPADEPPAGPHRPPAPDHGPSSPARPAMDTCRVCGEECHPVNNGVHPLCEARAANPGGWPTGKRTKPAPAAQTTPDHAGTTGEQAETTPLIDEALRLDESRTAPAAAQADKPEAPPPAPDPAPENPARDDPEQETPHAPAAGVATRRLRRPWTAKATAYLTWSTGRGVDDAGAAVTVPARASVGQLLAAMPLEVQRVVLVGAMPGKTGPGLQDWCTGQLEAGWTAGAHYLDPDSLAAHYVRPDGGKVDLHRLASWSRDGAANVRPDQAAAAFALFRAGLAHVFAGGRRKPGERVRDADELAPAVLASPSSTGRELLLRSLPAGHAYPVLEADQLELIHHTTGQGRNELLTEHRGDQLPGLYGYDMRWSYAALCRTVTGSGPALLDSGSEFLGFAPARYEVEFTVPDGWARLGLLPVHGEGWPNRPGTRWRTWADARELRLADRWGWRIEDMRITRRLLLHVDREKSTPLRTWADKLITLRETWLPAQDAPAPVVKLARDFARTVLLTALGALYGRRQRMTHALPRERAAEVPEAAEAHLAGDQLVWTTETDAGWREMVHPEWVAQVWAEQRCRLLDTGPNAAQANAGALHVPYADLVALRTDAVYATTDPGWADPGAVGQFRRQLALEGPVPTPRSAEALLALRGA